MSRFCAVFGETPRSEILQMGAAPVYADSLCSLGTLNYEGKSEDALYGLHGQAPRPDLRVDRPHLRAENEPEHPVVAVGDVVLLNRSEIESEAGTPAGCSDGDVLLALYARFGCAGLARVRGMFALAIWDEASLTLVSDAIGARSVFYTYVNEHWAVSSSLRALRRWPRLPVAINYDAMRSFLTCAYLLGDETLLQGVLKLVPASSVRLYPDGSREATSYWEPPESPWDPTDPPDVYAEHLGKLLGDAASLCLPKNQDVVCFCPAGWTAVWWLRLHPASMTGR